MEIKEFGKENSKKIMLIPGTMMCWKQFEPIIPLLQKNYHVIAVSTDGFDGSKETEIRKVYPKAEDHPFPGIGHGEILSFPEEMVREISKFVEDENT